LPKALKSCPKSNKSPNLISLTGTLLETLTDRKEIDRDTYSDKNRQRDKDSQIMIEQDEKKQR